MYQPDNGGMTFKCNDIKVYTTVSTWAMRLSQLAYQEGTVRIITYSLPKLDYVRTQLARRPHDIFLVAHEKFTDRALEIKKEFPLVQVATHPNVHSKTLLIEPKTIYIGSDNFGSSGWHESTVGFHSREIHDWYVLTMFNPLWEKSNVLGGAQ